MNYKVLDNNMKQDNFCFIEGQRIFLRALLESDVEGPYPGWLNDELVCQGTSHYVYPYSKIKALEYIHFANKTKEALILAIVLKEDNIHIGNIALQNINGTYRSADLAILLGDKTYWGKGYGLEAGSLLIKHGFIALNLNRIACATFESNEGMKKLAFALGMQQEGIRKNAAYKNGRYIDIIEFGLLREHFHESNLIA